MTHVARVYDSPGPDDGVRVLVDRLWPRGVRKDDPRIDQWWRDLAPSAELRTWFAHRADRWEEFTIRYEQELTAPAAEGLLQDARRADRSDGLTLLTATKDLSVSHAVVLARLVDHHHE